MTENRGVAQFGRAPRLGRGSRRSKSCHPDIRYVAWNVALSIETTSFNQTYKDSAGSDTKPFASPIVGLY